MLPNSLINFEIQKYYQNESNFNGVYSRDSLHKIRWACLLNLDQYESAGSHWIAPGEDSGLVKLVVMTNIFFNN